MNRLNLELAKAVISIANNYGLGKINLHGRFPRGFSLPKCNKSFQDLHGRMET